MGRHKLPTPERRQNDNDQGKTREFKDRAREASCLPSGIKRMVEFEGSNKLPRRANYVCSENSYLIFFSQGQCFVAVNPNMFADGFEDRMQALLDQYRNLQPVCKNNNKSK